MLSLSFKHLPQYSPNLALSTIIPFKCTALRLSSSQSVASGPAAPAALGNVLEMHIIGPHHRTTESKTLAVEHSNLGFKKPSR